MYIFEPLTLITLHKMQWVVAKTDMTSNKVKCPLSVAAIILSVPAKQICYQPCKALKPDSFLESISSRNHQDILSVETTKKIQKLLKELIICLWALTLQKLLCFLFQGLFPNSWKFMLCYNYNNYVHYTWTAHNYHPINSFIIPGCISMKG